MYKEKFSEYLEDLAEKLPAPGGGSASGLVACLGIALLEMSCNFTVGKPKYKEVEAEIKEILEKLVSLRGRLEELIDEDVFSYQELSLAYRLKEKEKIQSALKKAIEVPLKICGFSLEGLRLSKIILEKANPNLITDTGGGVLFLTAGFNSAELNVRINLKNLKDRELLKKIQQSLKEQSEEVKEIKEKILKKVYCRL
ncbi:MAG: cyclodeaminase/cyclohydrolase family protein [Candidatus Omnitrophica bacterium]|nr:cyclodeaminase/cyclohydrolase family protein [Candidatus Omnitrophota bacterium]